MGVQVFTLNIFILLYFKRFLFVCLSLCLLTTLRESLGSFLRVKELVPRKFIQDSLTPKPLNLYATESLLLTSWLTNNVLVNPEPSPLKLMLFYLLTLSTVLPNTFHLGISLSRLISFKSIAKSFLVVFTNL